MSDLTRFHEAQKNSYQIALAEIKNGKKISHWMWYIFPQIIGLGRSSTAQYYSIFDLEEAVDYLKDSVLGGRLIEISEALLKLESRNASEIFGWPDNMKLHSSMTLFSIANPKIKVFSDVLDKFFHGEKDEATLECLKKIS